MKTEGLLRVTEFTVKLASALSGYFSRLVQCALVLGFLVVSSKSFAQPANDNWANAIAIDIPNDNFGVGVIQSATVNMTGSTNQAGEYLQNPTYNKTVWYKFSIPSHRLVRVKVMQPTEIMQSTDAGFFVYHSTATIPGMSDLAVYTPMFSLASYSENVCLEQGEYYVQVVAKNAANSDLYVELDVSYTYPVSTTHAHDQLESAYNIGTIGSSNSVNFSWDCLSIQSEMEYNSYFGADSINYTKSIWYRFTTDSHIDLYSFYINYPNSSFNGSPVSVRIFESPVTLASLDTSDVIFSIVRPMNSTYTHVICTLEPNTEYYVQILGRINYSGSSNFYMRHLGEGITTGPYPKEVGFSPLNDFGTIVPTPSPGTTVGLDDYFSCVAFLSNDTIQCGVVNPPNYVTIGATNYDMTTWFTVDVPNPANVLLRAYVRNQTCNSDRYDHHMYVRIFNQTPDNDCINFALPGSLYYEGPFDDNGAIVMNCLPVGKYSIQLLAKSGMSADPYNCSNAQYGRRVHFTINLMGVPNTEYALLTPGDVDWINTGLPLLDNVLYTADSSSFSCEKTVIPDTAICSTIVDRAMYRQLIIGDADGDAVPDSGMVTIENYNYYNEIQNHLVKSVFYKGDAEVLAAAQNAYSWPDQITGLDPYEGCNMYNNFFRPQYPYNIPHNPKKFCVTPGTYTLVNVGDSTENGAIMAPRFRFKKTITNHWDPDYPYDMGDIIAQGLNVLSPADTFSCRDNPATIAGLAPCGGFTKLIYREFYISQDCRITVSEISGTTQPSSQMRVFKGRVSTDGIAGLTLAPYHSGGCYNHYSGYSLPACATVPQGWYTAVSYGYGPTYDNNYAFHEATTYNNYTNLYNITHTTSIRVVADTTVPPGPFYYRPYKACVANNDNPLTWVNTGTASIPSGATSYTLCMERFKPIADTPYAAIPILGCSGTVRLAFYVFTTDEEYFVRICGIDGYSKELFPLDVRTDSLLLPTTTPIAGCTNSGNAIEICRLQPGTYTLVVYGSSSQDCVTFTPVISVQPVDVSRFDFAVNAYDFGLIPGDANYHPGKVGDVHPTDPTLLPSNDFFYCTTGAFTSDPSGACTSTVYAPIYPDHTDNAYFQEPGTQTWYKRRNLWYTFVVQGMGQATIQIRNLTNPSAPIAFKMYRSDVDGELDFSNLLALGELDSTLASGLTEVHSNISGYYCTRSEVSTYTFINDICQIDTTKRRYYIIAELDEYYISFPNVQMDLQIKWTPINSNPIDPKYDFYSHANVIGNDEDLPPYSDVALQYNTFYQGGWGNMSCATGDAADALFYSEPYSCLYYGVKQKTLWWKFKIDEPGFIHLAIESDDTPANSFTRRLLQQITPGDSIISTNGSTGLHSLGAGSSVSVPGGGGLQWYRFCVDPGEYYYHVQRCANVDTSNVRAHAYFTTITGNNCSNAPSAVASTFGVYPLSVPVLCHSMGDDFGEDENNLDCLLGPDGYKSTWFKFSYTGSDLADILFQLNLSSISNYISPANVRYRLFYGSTCETMMAGQECSTNAYINNSIACVSGDEGDFYVQVVYPASTTGTLGFTFTVSPNSNPDCNPFNPTLLVSDFFYQPNCAGDSLVFFNYGTSGSSVEYLWDFGDGETSTEDNPTHAYAPGDYDVTLYVINSVLNDTVSYTQTVTLSPTGSPLDLGPDQTICLGEYATIGQSLTQASYVWSTGETTESIQVSTPGWYYLDIEWGGCPYSDSIQIHVIDLAFDLGSDVFFCAGESVTLSPAVYAGVDFLWSDGSAEDSLLITQEGEYYLDISIGNCVQSDTVQVDVLDLSFTLGNDTIICAGSTYEINPVVANGVSYLWSDNSSGSSLSVQTAGTYSLTVSDQGCSASDEIEIGVLDLSFTLGNDTLFCVGESLTITPQVEPGVSYLWNDNSSGSSLTINVEGEYYLDIEKLGCFASDTIYVSELDLSFTLGNDTTICIGESLTLNPSVLQGVSFDWSTQQTAPTVTVSNPGLYSLTITRDGCEAYDDIELSVLDLAFTLGNDTTICNGSSLTLQPSVMSGVNFTWSDGSSGSSITVSDAGTYSLEIDSLGCTADDEVLVSIFYVDAIVPSPFEICLNDTAHVQATGIDSLQWTTGNSFVLMYSPISFGLFPDVNTAFNWIAFENGCTETGTVVVDVLQPFIPVVNYIDYYCSNDEYVELPDIPGTTGDFYFNQNLIQSLEINGLPSGNHILEYRYTDDLNNCPWQIELPFEIADTTEITFISSPQICVDSNPVMLDELVNIPGGDFEISYVQSSAPSVSESSFNPASISDNLTTPGVYQLSYSYQNTASCTSRANGIIEVYPLPVIDIEVPNACAGENLLIVNNSAAAGSTATAMWDFGSNTINQWSPVGVNYPQEGNYNYSLTITSAMGCVSQKTGSITIHAIPIPSFSWQGGCVGEEVTFSDESTVADGNLSSYNWLFSGVSFGDSEQATYTFVLHSTYQVTHQVTSEFGCAALLTLPVTVLPTPTGVIVADNHCFGESVNISAQYSPANGTIMTSSWSIAGEHFDNLPQVNYTFPAPGVYQIEQSLTNENDCTNILRDSLEVYPLPIPGYENSRYELCLNESDYLFGTSQIEAPFYVAQEYWAFTNGFETTGSELEFIGKPVGTIGMNYTAVSNKGCEASIIDNNVYAVRPLPYPGFILSPEVLSYEKPNMTVTDSSIGAAEWLYTISDGSTESKASFVHKIESSGVYYITQVVSNQYGCHDSLTRKIEFNPDLIVHIPNAFTPDNDGVNDVFHPVIFGDEVVEYNLIIWDRWGMEIFNSENPDEVWVGNVLGGEYYAKDGVYNYRLFVRGRFTDEKVFKGSITLLR